MANLNKPENLIVGRTQEVESLKLLFSENRSRLVSIVGRRRVGKTYLVNQVFKNKIVFQVTGVMDGSKKTQLQVFTDACIAAFKLKKDTPVPASWLHAFFFLRNCLGKAQKKKRVIFFDEIAWLAGYNREFISAFEYFWNTTCEGINVVVVICTSATHWMVKNVYNNIGGLYNRVTDKFHLEPFCLAEVKQYFEAKKIKFTNQEIISIYMAVGGIPFYLNAIRKSCSAEQAINHLYFGKKALLNNEFNQLYKALFKNADDYITIIKLLFKKKSGLTRNQLLQLSKFNSGGTLTKILQNLEQCQFILSTSSLAKKQRDTIYRLIDEYSIFYLQFIENNKNSSDYWLKNFNAQATRVWSSFAFENLCYRHVQGIKIALGINGMFSYASSFWHKQAQVDMLLVRADNFINIIEIKYHNNIYSITNTDSEKFRLKQNLVEQALTKRKGIISTLITLNGVANNMHKFSVYNIIQANKLFAQKELE
jgi:uncharacterized protein